MYGILVNYFVTRNLCVNFFFVNVLSFWYVIKLGGLFFFQSQRIFSPKILILYFLK